MVGNICIIALGMKRSFNNFDFSILLELEVVLNLFGRTTVEVRME